MVKCIGCNVINTDKKQMVLIHTVSDMKQSEKAVGKSVEVLFLKSDYCEDIFGIPFTAVNPQEFEGKEIFVSRNRKGYVDRIEICE